MSRPRFHVVASNITPADAVTRDALGMAAWLRGHGFVADVYGGFVHPSLRGQAHLLSAYAARAGTTDDVLVYHHSVGWPAGFELWQASRNQKILRYHNITPARYLQAYDRASANLCRRGCLETMKLVHSAPMLALPASDFSAAELARNAEQPFPIEVVPPFHAAGELDDARLDEELVEQLRGTINLLFVGRVAPHKGHGRLLRALACCRNLLGDGVRLFVVGATDPRLSGYYRELRNEAAARGVDNLVCFTGPASASQLRSYYRFATAFLCLSEHEGFCVPLVEAMRLGVPVVAYRGSAIGSTLGDHPFLWDAPDPLAAAESVRSLVENPIVRSSVVEWQRERYEQMFAPEAIGRRFGAALAGVIPGAEFDVNDATVGRMLQFA
jgi:glycosyltransferase involved in cell wall biosynthesis